MTKTEKLLAAFRRGDKLTQNEIMSRYGLDNPRSAVMRIRDQGYSVNLYEATNSKGQVRRRYGFGYPPREVIAAGYAALRG